jgi:hypothetical protein
MYLLKQKREMSGFAILVNVLKYLLLTKQDKRYEREYGYLLLYFRDHVPKLLIFLFIN